MRLIPAVALAALAALVLSSVTSTVAAPNTASKKGRAPTRVELMLREPGRCREQIVPFVKQTNCIPAAKDSKPKATKEPPSSGKDKENELRE